MKFYIDEQTKQELKAKIETLEKTKHETDFTIEWNEAVVMINLLKDILSSSTILPVEKDMEDVIYKHNMDEYRNTYPNGVIIQPKQ
jgi:hypothetical protein